MTGEPAVRRVAPRTARLLAGVALVVAAGGCMPQPATTQAQAISDLYAVFLAGGIVVAVVVWGLVTWAILRYRRRDDQMPRQSEGNLRIEAVWTLIPLATVLVLFLLTVRTLGTVGAVDPGGVDLHVTAFRWQWQATYPADGVTLTGTTANELEVVLPVDTPIHVTLESLDVNHSWYVPRFLFKRDAIPGRPTSFELRITDTGSYPGACAEFCGIGHDAMLFSIRAVEPADFAAWLAEQAAAGSPQP